MTTYAPASRFRSFQRSLLWGTAGGLALLLGHPACAQTSVEGAKATSENADPGEANEVVVTGSRIVRDGYSAPTPVTVLSGAEIAAQKPANISDFVNTLPAIGIGSTAQNSSGSLSDGTAGIASINLRGLGPTRTLVLVDGQRSVGSTANQVVDVNTIPQDLVERVEVVTGGASAQYGSDAIGGVVNFILDTKFKGVKLSADQGITTFGDGHSYRFTGTAGLSFLDDRLHVLLNGEYYHQSPIDSVNRSWNNKGFFTVNNPAYTAANGQPQYLVTANAGPNGFTAGGLVTSGALRGTYFLPDGVTRQLNYGAVSSPWMVGGDWQTTLDGIVGTQSLMAGEKRISLFDRTSFDVSDNLTIFGQFSWNRYDAQSFFAQQPSTITIQADNAYLQTLYPQVAASMRANGLSSIPVGAWNTILGVPGSDNRRDVYRYVAGAKGGFSLFGHDWSWNAYYQHGETKSRDSIVNNWIISRLALATDAVLVTSGNVGSSGLALGSIACRSTLSSPTNGCVPVNRLGTAPLSAAAKAYLTPSNPYRGQKFQQDVASVSVTGQLFDLPGGAASIATGGEWRKERLSTTSLDPFYGSGWGLGNYLSNKGGYSVKEGFVELDLPVLRGVDLSAAGRYTDYTTSGSVQTWKLGATYSPIPDVKFRGNYSHDIRAPNVQELFVSANAGAGSVTFPSNAPTPGVIALVQPRLPNRDLRPERAATWTAGAVLTPRFLPGFAVSFDYYEIKIRDAIGSVSAQQTIDLCYSGNTAFCQSIIYSGATPVNILVVPVNFAKQRAKGFDISTSYRLPLSTISESLPGTFRIQANTTHYIKNVTDNGVFPVDAAGVNGGFPLLSTPAPNVNPAWVYRVSAFYELDPVTINLVGRGFSSGVYGKDYVECTSNCPASSTRYRTINYNHTPSAFYLDGSISVKVPAASHTLTLSLIVRNMLNSAPKLLGNGPTSTYILAYPQTNESLYDTVGRVFRVAAGVKF
ncbi:TonB-dependent receptor [Sphingomonas sp. AP4-R1]|uniref:TonB-dependent receptor plug domain-containing protein n=1 Tax=Sphingomonas sp. AP4-R1 TaxID=2735134 RepID=UPI0014939EF9|nr:TonB-dependent receptor [Sphingomonas sp. AP4-R1]QJU56957.1 TonB-dependent receptor [Sphingomonas sp. AP4-R1]